MKTLASRLALFSLAVLLPVLSSNAGEQAKVALDIKCDFLRDNEVIASPRIVTFEGEKFAVRIGNPGQETISLAGVANVGLADQVTTDLTYEIDQWNGETKNSRRVTQATSSRLGNTVAIGSIRDANNKNVQVQIRISLAKAD